MSPTAAAPTAPVLYELSDVEVSLDRRRVLQIPQLSLAEGRVTAVVGPNGAGKTTLLRLLAFLLEPTRGRIAFRGDSVRWGGRALGPLRREVTLVMQDPYLFHGSVAMNVGYGIRVRGMSRTERRARVAAALSRVGLAVLESRAARGLSGGEARRVSIARALAVEPRVLLLDEPMAGVDAGSVAAIEGVIVAEGGRPGRTVVFTTHDLRQAYRCAETVLSLLDGCVAHFPLTNLFRGTMRSENGVPFFDTGRLRFAVPELRPGVRFLALDPEDVLLSRAPLRSSARNVFVGVVRTVEADGRCCRVTVDCGEPIVALVTLRSWSELEVRPGERVHLTVKSTALHLH